MKATIEPYRILFSFGTFGAALGVAIWPAYFHLSPNGPYPMASHMYLMVYGFLLAFVSGFLMTAMPRMSGTRPATLLESVFSLFPLGIGMSAALLNKMELAYGCTVLQFVLLFRFGLTRFGHRQNPLPSAFIYVPVGLLWGLIGAILMVLQVEPRWAQVAMQEAFLTNLIVGLGSRLIPFLSGVNEIAPDKAQNQSPRRHLILLIGLNSAFILQASGLQLSSQIVKTASLAFAGLVLLKLLKRPLQRRYLGMGVRAAVWMMILSQILLLFLPQQRIAIMHLYFVSGLGLLTFMIATRVILAHGGHSLDFELNSPFIPVVLLGLIATAIARAIYWLDFAAAAWLISCGIWFVAVGRLMLVRRKGEISQC